MKRLLPFALLASSTLAFAQDSDLAAQTPGEALTGSGQTTLWTTEAVELKRFPDRDEVTVALAPSTQVTLVLADGNRYRVRRGSDFGWADASAVSVVPPAGSTTLQLTPPPL